MLLHQGPACTPPCEQADSAVMQPAVCASTQHAEGMWVGKGHQPQEVRLASGQGDARTGGQTDRAVLCSMTTSNVAS